MISWEEIVGIESMGMLFLYEADSVLCSVTKIGVFAQEALDASWAMGWQGFLPQCGKIKDPRSESVANVCFGWNSLSRRVCGLN